MEDYQNYKITIELLEPMLGTIPKNEKVYKTFIESKNPKGEEDGVDMEKLEEKSWTGFHKDEEGIFIFDYMVKGFMKNAGNVLKEPVGIKALKSKIEDTCFIYPRRIRPDKDILPEPVERPLRGMTKMGPITCLARSDVLPRGTKFEFTLEKIGNKITDKALNSIFDYGTRKGLGQFRNGGYGRFKVLEMKKIKQ